MQYIDEHGFIRTVTDNVEKKIDLPLLPVTLITADEVCSMPTSTHMVWDSEIYRNYIATGFKVVGHDKFFVMQRDTEGEIENTLNLGLLRWMFWNFTMIGFNSLDFDNSVLAAILEGWDNSRIKDLVDHIINNSAKPFILEQEYGIKIHKYKSVDLMNVCPLQGSLKTYVARLHGRRLQDLPIEPGKILDLSEKRIVGNYLLSDLEGTETICMNLLDQLTLRQNMSQQYGIDLMSKSDAQIAEAVIGNEIKKITGEWPSKSQLNYDYQFKYDTPDFIQAYFDYYGDTVNPELRKALKLVQDATFTLQKNGSPATPKSLYGLTVNIGAGRYRMGLGGLHSSEKSVAHVQTAHTRLIDIDVESFYPRIIINQRLYPEHLGTVFLDVFESIVDRRVTAKRNKDKTTSDSLKIVINGTYGKLGSPYSIMYSPKLMLQTTFTGQLCLLMFIDMLHRVGIRVVSANTDGIVTMPRVDQLGLLEEVKKQWEQGCDYTTEETHYLGLYSRDVNNYVALKKKYSKESNSWVNEIDSAKLKGEYSNPWSDKDNAIFRFHKNPTATIVSETVVEVLKNNVDIMAFIRSQTDIKKFIIVRNIRGGGVNGANGQYLGKVARWYYSVHTKSCSIRYYQSGNQVATSEGANPLMDLPDELPTDIDYNKYAKMVKSALSDIGYFGSFDNDTVI